MKPKAPELIREIQRRYHLTQKDLERELKISQQAVSDYLHGRVENERHDVITTLEKILSGKIKVQSTAKRMKGKLQVEGLKARAPMEMKVVEDVLAHQTVEADEEGRPLPTKKARLVALQKGGSSSRSRRR